MELVTLIAAVAACLASLICLAVLWHGRAETMRGEDLEKVRQDLLAELRATRQELTAALSQSAQAAARQQMEAQQRAAEQQDRHLQEAAQHLARQQALAQKALTDQLGLMNTQLANTALQNEQKLEQIRAAVETRLAALQADNNRQLTEIRGTVEDKLQKTLDDKLHQSFSLVSERLEMVYKGLGEMQSLAAGVGDLKKVLSNVKTRGILGEVQLGAILEQLLAPGQYTENIATRPGSTERVEYALRLPGAGEEPVWMPIDAKFPQDAYSALLAAYDTADAVAVESAAKDLERRVRGFARDIHDKYIAPPHTTDFGVMFLPVEGLYAELVRRGVAERVQREYRITMAGPTTMAALLNSLQMGFRTLAIQKRSGEVWQVLGSVKAEFDTFGQALTQAQTRIQQAGSELENLVGVRTRQIQRKLQAVTLLPEPGQPGQPGQEPPRG